MTPVLPPVSINKDLLSALCEQCKKLYNYSHKQVSFKSGYDKGVPADTDAPEITSPLEDTVRDRLERILGNSLPSVTIHRGGQTQENLRAAGACAMASGNDIYIRQESYLEGSQLTDQILVHELTHVLQTKQQVIKTKEDIEKAEQAAEQNEQLVQYTEDPWYYVRIGGRIFKVNRQLSRQAVSFAIEELKQTVRDASERNDTELLAKIQKMLERRTVQ
jgi:hypothetical protein